MKMNYSIEKYTDLSSLSYLNVDKKNTMIRFE